MTKEEILEIFKASGGMLSGHFKLTSGRHSASYMQCAKLFINPDNSERLCAELANKIHEDIDIVASPAVGGIIMGYVMAKHLNCLNVFAERVNGKMELRRGFNIAEGAKALIVEDVVTTGGSVKEVIELVESLGAKVVAVASIVDRSGGKVDFMSPFYSLLSMDITSYEAEECPLCKQGLPIQKPGSRELK
ncbi:MAG: orotate phosphoribosyltransferase [Christensenellales bacterium]|jgi:orotate phosphoribosyltransferase